ncbi:MAG TPA: bifunctional riboflavin kinase/FAD synthetase [Anaerolineaceae bacterium]|nr:bifunctional riboflavin kinase/FAD synthetase [Anaerolineaceae bacterium]
MESTDNNKPLKNQVMYATIGAFDGIHKGHQQLIRSMVRHAKEKYAETLVVTFHPHPAVVLRSIAMPFYITSPDEKEKIFRSLGIDHVISIEFNLSMSNQSPEQFLMPILEQYPITQFWLGSDFALGKNRSGNLSTLIEIGKTKGFTIHTFQHLEDNGGKISSSKVRQWILSGDFLQVTQALNRFYSVEGVVIHGDSRGRKLGFPTANLDIWEGKLLPSPGVYATWIEIDGLVHQSVTNVGIRPTFDNQSTQIKVETYIHKFNQEIYKNHVKLHFVEKTRNEIKFESVDQLINQIQKDVIQAEEILKNATKPTNLFT